MLPQHGRLVLSAHAPCMQRWPCQVARRAEGRAARADVLLLRGPVPDRLLLGPGQRPHRPQGPARPLHTFCLRQKAASHRTLVSASPVSRRWSEWGLQRSRLALAHALLAMESSRVTRACVSCSCLEAVEQVEQVGMSGGPAPRAEAGAHVQPLQHGVLGLLRPVGLLLVGRVRALRAGLLQLVRAWLFA